MTLGALAEHERVAPPTVTKVVGKLEALGLVVRRADPSDRRVARVSITDTGAALLGEVRQRKDVWLAARLAQMDEGLRSRLAEALDALDALTRQDPS
jgi:DNA-binding MarR family transcriptional regulator